MKGTVLRHCTSVPVFLISLCVASSCVNEEYTFKDIDKEVNVLKNVSLPLGNVDDAITLGEILQFNENSIISTDNDGNLSLDFSSESPVSTEFTIPAIKLTSFDEGYVNLNLDPIKLNYIPSVTLPDINIPLRTLEYDIVIDADNLPKEIKSVHYVGMNADINVSLGFSADSQIPVKKINIRKGSGFKFPSWMILGELNNADLSKDGNTISFKSDVSIYSSDNKKPFVFTIPIRGIDFSQLPEGQGFVGGKIHVDAHVSFDGEIIIPGSGISTEGTFAPKLETSVAVKNIEISSIKMNFDAEIKPELPEVKLDGIPEVLKDNEITLDFSDVSLDLSILNKTPLAGSISVDVATYNGQTKLADAQLGPLRFDSWDGTTNISPVEWKFDDASIRNLIKKIPERIIFDNFSFVPASTLMEVKPGSVYRVDISYGLHAPMSFGQDLKLTFTQEFKNLDVSFDDLDLSSVKLNLDLVNTIPLDFSVSAEILDAEGKVVDGLTAVLENEKVNAGSLAAPTTTSVSLVLNNTGKSISFDGIRLNLAATGNANYSDVSLNVNQGMSLKSLVINLPEGITTEL